MLKVANVLAALVVGGVAVGSPSSQIGVDATGQPVQYFNETKTTTKITTTEAKPAAAAPVAKASVEKSVARQELDAIYFDVDAARLNDAAKNTLAKAANWLKANPNAKAHIEAEADQTGTAQHNLALSKRRVASVAGYLKGLGVSAKRLSTKALGEATERKATIVLQ